MKHSIISCAMAAGVLFSAQAFAETSSIDLFVGDFMGVATVDTVKLAANSMIGKAIDDNAKQDTVQKILASLSAYGIDYKKDIGMITAAATDKGDFCFSVDAKKSLADTVKKYAEQEKANLTAADRNGVTVYTEKDGTRVALVSDTRLLACEKGLDIFPIIDNAKAAKPKLLKDRDSAVYKAYSATPKSADIRVGAKMTQNLRTAYGNLSLDDGAGKTIALGDAQTVSLSIDFSKGLAVEVAAQTKSAEKASAGEAILAKQVGGLLSDPAMEQLGLGFLGKAVKFTANKTDLKGVISLTNDQIAQIAILLTELMGDGAAMK